jgi:DNA adenine methylase
LLLRELSFLISSRRVLKDFVAQPGLTDIQRAARFYYKNRASFGGGMRTFAVSKTKGGGASFPQQRNLDLLGGASERLDGVVIENVPYERCFDLYDGPETFFFLDPPYLNSKPNAYEGWTEQDINLLAKRVRDLKGKWLLTLDDSEFNRTAFADYRIQSVSTRNGCVNIRTNPSERFAEIIVSAF